MRIGRSSPRHCASNVKFIMNLFLLWSCVMTIKTSDLSMLGGGSSGGSFVEGFVSLPSPCYRFGILRKPPSPSSNSNSNVIDDRFVVGIGIGPMAMFVNSNNGVVGTMNNEQPAGKKELLTRPPGLMFFREDEESMNSNNNNNHDEKDYYRVTTARENVDRFFPSSSSSWAYQPHPGGSRRREEEKKEEEQDERNKSIERKPVKLVWRQYGLGQHFVANHVPDFDFDDVATEQQQKGQLQQPRQFSLQHDDDEEEEEEEVEKEEAVVSADWRTSMVKDKDTKTTLDMDHPQEVVEQVSDTSVGHSSWNHEQKEKLKDENVVFDGDNIMKASNEHEENLLEDEQQDLSYSLLHEEEEEETVEDDKKVGDIIVISSPPIVEGEMKVSKGDDELLLVEQVNGSSYGGPPPVVQRDEEVKEKESEPVSTGTTIPLLHPEKTNIFNINIGPKEYNPISIVGNIQKEEEAIVEEEEDSLPGSNFNLVCPTEDEIDLQDNQRLICIGDVHGDFNALQEFLTIAGVYDRRQPIGKQWIGGNTIVVQCGDVLDRGTEELACFSLLTQLSQQADRVGGHVMILFGNHEVLNAAGLFHYTNGDAEYEEVLGPILDDTFYSADEWRQQYAHHQPARWAAFEPGGFLSHPLMKNLKVAVKVGRTVCVHAGLTAQHVEEYGGLSAMNRNAQEWIAREVGSIMEEQHPKLAEKEEGDLVTTNGDSNNDTNDDSDAGELDNHNNDSDESSAVVHDFVDAATKQAYTYATIPSVLGGKNADQSPLWMRDYSSPSNLPPKNAKFAQAMIDDCLTVLDCDRMVMGHTVQREINCALGGKAWRVDVGASRGVMGGIPEVLEVSKRNGTEVVSVLSKRYGSVPEQERQVFEFNVIDLL